MAGFDTRNALNLAIRALTDSAIKRAAGGWIPPKEAERRQKEAMRDEQAKQRDAQRQEQAQQKQFIADEKERQKNLMAWHKQSHDITKNPDGSPKVFYHGTKGDFSAYDLTAKRKNNANNPMGIYVTGNPQEASNYATKYGDEIQDANIMPVYVHVKNPFLRGSKVTPEMLSLLEDEIVKNNPHKDREYAQSKVRETIAKAQRGNDAMGIFPSMDLPNDVKTRVLQAGGYDGFTDGPHLIAFDSNQIKSATGNQGTFDPSNPDITKSEGGQILSKQFPTHYMPNVGRQVMQDGGFALPQIKPSTNDPDEVGAANFDHYDVVHDTLMPIESMAGGVNLNQPDQRKRIDALKAKIANPEDGYISRVIVDDDGNVIEGQHRFEALKALGATHVPVTVIRNKAKNIDMLSLRNAIRGEGGIPSDHVNQIANMAIDSVMESGHPSKAREEWEAPRGFEKHWNAALTDLERQYSKKKEGMARGGKAKQHPAMMIAGTHIREEEHGTPIFTGER